MKIVTEAPGKEPFGTRALLINDIIRAYNKFPESRKAIMVAYEKVANKPWDNSMSSGENLMKLPTEDLRYIQQEVEPTYSGKGGDDEGEMPRIGRVVDFNFSVKTTEKGYDIISNKDGRNKRAVRSGSSLVGVKEFITDWIENELN